MHTHPWWHRLLPHTRRESFLRVRTVNPESCELYAAPNFTLKPVKGLLQGPAAEPPPLSQASRRHAGCRSLPPTEC